MSWKNVQYKNGKYKTSEGGGGASNFAELDDVSFSNLQNGQVPKYNSTTQKWENANESGGGHTYSTTEQVVSTWIDGKPVYEKTITGTTIAGGQNTYVNHNIQNFDTLVDCNIITHFSDNDFWRQLNFVYNNGNTSDNWLGGYAISSTQIVFQIGTSYAQHLDKWHATIKYTKNTD
jgi:hypothetical protein